MFAFGVGNLASIIVTIVTTPFILILTFINIGFIRSARKASASNQWPTATGRVLTAEVTSHRSRNSNGTHTTIYEPKIVYEYNAEGHQYQSSQISFSAIGGMSSSGWAEKTVNKYSQGSSVEVYYNPSKPDEAVLEHSGAGFGGVLVLILGAVELILIGVLVAAWSGRLG